MADYVKKIRTKDGDLQIDYTALANLPKSDTTLTKAGYFADAKATGDAITNINNAINVLSSTKADKTVTDGLDGRMTSAEQRLDTVETVIANSGQIDVKDLKDRTAIIEQRLDGAEDAIELKADKTVTDDLSKRVTQAEQNIVVLTDTKADKTELDALNKQLDQTTDDLSSVKDELASKVSQSQFDTFNNKVTGELSDLGQSVEGLQYEVYNSSGIISTLTKTDDIFRSEIRDNAGNISLLVNDVTGLTSRVTSAEGNVSTLQNTAEGLTHEVYDADGKVSTLKNTVDGLSHEVNDADGKVSTLKNTVDGLSHEVYDEDGKFSLLTNTVNGLHHEVYAEDGKMSTLENTVNGLTSTVSDNAGNISKLSNTVDGLTSDVSGLSGKFSTLKNTVDGLSHEVYDGSGKFAKLESKADGLYHEVYEEGGKFATLTNTVDGLTSTVSDNTGNISTLTNTVNGLTSTVSDNKGNISTLTNSVNGISTRVTSVEGKTSTLEQTANKIESAVFNSDGSSKITQLSTQITLKVNTSDLQDKVASYITIGTDNVTIAGKTIDLSGYVKASQLATAGLTTSGSLKTNLLSVSGGFDYQGNHISISSTTVGENKTLKYLGISGTASSIEAKDLPHSHSVSVSANGTVTLGGVSTTGGNFNIANTTFYKNAILAIKNGYLSFSNIKYSNKKYTGTITLLYEDGTTFDSWTDWSLDATSAYDAGHSDGYTSGHNAGYSAGSADEISKIKNGYLSFSNVKYSNKKYTGTISLLYENGATFDSWTDWAIDATSAYDAGANSVTATKGTPTATYVSSTNGYSVNIPYTLSNGKSGTFTHSLTATDAYNAGKSSVTLSSPGWQNGTVIVTASNGKTYTVNLPAFSTSGGTSFDANNKTTVYFSTASVNAPLKQVTVDASSVYNAGKNSVTATKGTSTATYTASTNGYSVNIPYTLSNGKSGTFTHSLTATAAYNAGKNSVTATKGTPTATYDANTNGYSVNIPYTLSNGGSGTFTHSVIATEAYNAGWAAAVAKIRSDGANIYGPSATVGSEELKYTVTVDSAITSLRNTAANTFYASGYCKALINGEIVISRTISKTQTISVGQ